MPRRKRAACCSSVAPNTQRNFDDMLFGPHPTMQVFSGYEAKQAQQEQATQPPPTRRRSAIAAGKLGEASAVSIAPSPFAPLAPFVPVYRVKLVKAGKIAWNERAVLSSPRALVELMETHLKDIDREHFALVLLDTKNRVIGISTVSVGDLGSSLAHPREVFKPALLCNAASVLLFHNHPSGSPEPSHEDVQMTKRLGDAGCLLGVSVLDHVILGGEGRWVSMQQAGLYDPVTDYTDWKPSGSEVCVHTVFGGATFIGDKKAVKMAMLDMRDMGEPGNNPGP